MGREILDGGVSRARIVREGCRVVCAFLWGFRGGGGGCGWRFLLGGALGDGGLLGWLFGAILVWGVRFWLFLVRGLVFLIDECGLPSRRLPPFAPHFHLPSMKKIRAFFRSASVKWGR